MSDDRVECGPVEWAVVTRYLVPAGLFVRLEESGEEAFMDFTAVHIHPLCRNPEYWPDVGERIRVCRLLVSGLNEIRVVRWESKLEGLVDGFPTRDPSTSPSSSLSHRTTRISFRPDTSNLRTRIRSPTSGQYSGLQHTE